MSDLLVSQFLTDPDAQSRRAELEAFIGPNSYKFMRVYDAMHMKANWPADQPLPFKFADGVFLWPPFLIGAFWLLYRKVWVWGFCLLALTIALMYLPFQFNFGIPIGIALAITGARIYIRHAICTIVKMRRNSPSRVIPLEELAAAGGPSLLAGWIIAIVLGIITLANGYSRFVAAR